jgi:hypothetical protein
LQCGAATLASPVGAGISWHIPMPMQHGAWQSAEEQMYGRLEWMTMLLAASNNMSPS